MNGYSSNWPQLYGSIIGVAIDSMSAILPATLTLMTYPILY